MVGLDELKRPLQPKQSDHSVLAEAGCRWEGREEGSEGMGDHLKQCQKWAILLSLIFFYKLCLCLSECQACAQPAAAGSSPVWCPAMQVVLGPMLTQKYRFYSTPLCSGRRGKLSAAHPTP